MKDELSILRGVAELLLKNANRFDPVPSIEGPLWRT
jgi:hypothetical protein